MNDGTTYPGEFKKTYEEFKKTKDGTISFEEFKETRRTEWEVINANLDRIVVPGGWLYRTFDYNFNTKVLAMTFVPFVPELNIDVSKI